MAQQYEPFVIEVDELRDNVFPVTARFQGTSWSASIPAALPLLQEREVRQALRWLEKGFIDQEYAQDFGGRLFQTLFTGGIREGFRSSYGRVAPEGGLRIILTLPPVLAGLPWELIYDEEHGFLARSATAPLVRHFRSTVLAHKLPRKGPLRILIVTASPPGYPPTSSEEEAKRIGKSLAGRGAGILQAVRLLGRHLRHTRSLTDLFRRIRQRDLFEVEVLPHATRRSLQRQIIEAKGAGRAYHVIHFVGHGEADKSGGRLLFESEDTAAEPVSAAEFAELLAEPSISLAVLNACQTASADSIFRGVAQAALLRGVPAVIGMQVSILDRAAIRFAQDFYGAWAAGQPIEAALAYARRLVSEESPGAAADWSIPALYMGPTEGLRLVLEPPPPSTPPLWRFVRWAAAFLVSLLGTVALLLQVPNIAQAVRTEVPVVRCLYPYPMDGDPSFNVAVAEFAVVNEKGSPVGGRDGRLLAEYLFKQLEFSLSEFDLGLPYDLRSPAQTCRVRGETRSAREAAAEKLAGRIGANVVIYGVIIADPDRGHFSPEFYVSYQGFEEGHDITGQHEMGQALRVGRPVDAVPLTPTSNPALSARATALSLVTIGLAYYSVDDFEKAEKYFLRAEATEGWLDDAGKEVAYLLLGNANVRRASQENTTAYLNAAAEYYDAALEIEPAYARAKVGQAGVLYLLAIGDPADERLDTIQPAILDQAAAHYEAARNLGNPPASANIETKVHSGLGQVFLARGLYTQATAGDWSAPLAVAQAEFQQVIDEYEGGNARVENLAGQAHARLGLLAWVQGRIGEAIEHYTAAILLVTPYYRALYYSRLAEIYAEDGQAALASQACEEAIHIAEFHGFDVSAFKCR